MSEPNNCLICRYTHSPCSKKCFTKIHNLTYSKALLDFADSYFEPKTGKLKKKLKKQTFKDFFICFYEMWKDILLFNDIEEKFMMWIQEAIPKRYKNQRFILMIEEETSKNYEFDYTSTIKAAIRNNFGLSGGLICEYHILSIRFSSLINLRNILESDRYDEISDNISWIIIVGHGS